MVVSTPRDGPRVGERGRRGRAAASERARQRAPATRCGAPNAGARRAGRATGSRFAPGRPRRGRRQPAAAMRSRTRSRRRFARLGVARRARRATARAAGRRAAPPRRARSSAGGLSKYAWLAAPTPRRLGPKVDAVQVLLEDCVLGERPLDAQRERSHLATCRASVRGCGRRMRASCIVSVEPPETTRRCHSVLRRRRARARAGSTPWVRVEAPVLGGEHRAGTSRRPHLVEREPTARACRRRRAPRGAGARRGRRTRTRVRRRRARPARAAGGSARPPP